jgi:hypothetical protein
MAYFIVFALLVAATWAVIGVLLAKWLKQSGHARPFTGRAFSSQELYGGGVGYGRGAGFGGGAVGGEEGRERGVGVPVLGVGRVKGV